MTTNFSSPGLNCYLEFQKVEKSISSQTPIPGGDAEDRGNGKAVVVILIGWAGAKDKHLTKYSDIYASHGNSLQSLCPRPAGVVHCPSNKAKDCWRFLRIIYMKRVMVSDGLPHRPLSVTAWRNPLTHLHHSPV
ncbi:unnamed protein product [Allacma fusca]|uniref:Transmembrane protein 53 n=2 Tax=Allacma fusca TaxID=39272 RepID=A0A8J2K7G3_9HEXA|nr:unnamed protein product [Allacma fusca]